MAVIPWYANEKVRSLDARLIESGVPGLELMERVGRGIVDFILKRPRFIRRWFWRGPGTTAATVSWLPGF